MAAGRGRAPWTSRARRPTSTPWIVGRPAFTVLDEDFCDTQEGTLHFAHLTGAGGGMLTVAYDLDEHLGQLAGALTAGAPA
jgi:hypothetical protein